MGDFECLLPLTAEWQNNPNIMAIKSRAQSLSRFGITSTIPLPSTRIRHAVRVLGTGLPDASAAVKKVALALPSFC